jgi:catalase
MSKRDVGIGKGGETHQVASGGSDVMTTNHGVPVSDNQQPQERHARAHAS